MSEKKKPIGDLSQKSLPELCELLTRQNNLLRKTVFIGNLPDKGEKILKVKNQIEEEIRKREKSEVILPLDNMLHQTATETLEWTGAAACYREQPESDDSSDEKDPLKIFVSHASAGNYKKQYRITQPEKSLIQPEDLMDDAPVEPYASQLCEKDETLLKSTRVSYKPYRTVIPHEQSADKKPMKAHVWDENTAATPPHYTHTDAKIISLADSLALLKVQAVRLKEIKEKQAADRLCEQIQRLCVAEGDEDNIATVDVGEEQEEVEMAEQVLEEEAEGGGVSYTIHDVDASNMDGP